MPNYVNSILCKDLYAEFLRIRKENEKEGRYLTRVEICEIISRLPAPRFYITPATAICSAIRPLGKGRNLQSHGRRAQMHRELYRRYVELRKEYNKETALEIAIHQPAPSFYLSTRSICNLLYDAVRR